MLRFVLLPLALTFAGCGPAMKPMAAIADVSGSVKLMGQPMEDGVLNFQPTGPGSPATIPVKKGTFKTQLVPGQYTYFFSEGGAKSTYDKIPPAYRAGSMDRQVEIAPGAKLEFDVQ